MYKKINLRDIDPEKKNKNKQMKPKEKFKIFDVETFTINKISVVFAITSKTAFVHYLVQKLQICQITVPSAET